MKIFQKISFFFAIVIGILIFYVSSIPYLKNPVPGFSGTSIVYHFMIFFLFSLFLLFSKNFKKDVVFIVMLISFLYAGLDELHQYFVPGRIMDGFDLVIDFLGSFIALIVRVGFRKI
ncbi:MAG: VanZ family protein [Nanoarchaeota archaeon]